MGQAVEQGDVRGDAGAGAGFGGAEPERDGDAVAPEGDPAGRAGRGGDRGDQNGAGGAPEATAGGAGECPDQSGKRPDQYPPRQTREP